MNRSRATNCVGATLSVILLGVLTAPSAGADTVWTSGSASSAPDYSKGNWVGPVAGFPEDGKPCGNGDSADSFVSVKTYGDYVYVQDSCKDGRSAIAMISGHEGGHFHKRMCRNSQGYGTWVRCNYDWPEDITKNVVAGTHDGSTNDTYLYYGSAQTFREHDGDCSPNSNGQACLN